MPEYIINLWLDGYDTEEQMEEACDEFIYEQLNFTASGVRVKRSDYAALLTSHNALIEALRGLLGSLDNGEFKTTITHSIAAEMAEKVYRINRSEVDRLLEDK